MPTCMALRIVADSLEDLPDGLRESAKKEAAGFVVADMPEGWAVENITGLKASVVTARQERDEARKLARAFDGLDPAKAADARTALERLEAGQLRGSKEIEEYKATLEAKVAKDLARSEDRARSLIEQVKRLKIKGELSPIIAAKGGSDAMEAILTLAESRIRFEESDNGELKASLVGADGNLLMTRKAGSADPMGFDEFIDQMREAPGTRGLFKASAAGGSGGGSQSGGSGRPVGMDVSKMSPTELIALGNQRAR